MVTAYCMPRRRSVYLNLIMMKCFYLKLINLYKAKYLIEFLINKNPQSQSWSRGRLQWYSSRVLIWMNHLQKKRNSASDKKVKCHTIFSNKKIHNSEWANNQIFFFLILSSTISTIHLPKMEPHFFGFKKFVFAVSNSKIIIGNEIAQKWWRNRAIGNRHRRSLRSFKTMQEFSIVSLKNLK